MKKIIFIIALSLSACSTVETETHPTRAVLAESTLPPVKSFAPRAAPLPTRSNADMARDFLDLSFALESGRTLPRLTRFEGPITVRVEGRMPGSMAQDLANLLARLRNEARLDIQQVASGQANITIHSVSRRNIRRALPDAACFVVPNINSLSEYRRASYAPKTNWAALEKREQLAIFLPNDISPQEIRDCLHEELAQALGPLNDLFRLEDSVFNDDNFNPILTGFDMLMLRAFYDPALQNGMTRKEAATKIRAVLARLNPAGERRGSAPNPKTTDAWKRLMSQALGGTAHSSERIKFANQAIVLAKQSGWSDSRVGFAHFALARMLHSFDPKRAKQNYSAALTYFKRSAPRGPQAAFAQVELAGFSIAEGRPNEALRYLKDAEATARRYENAAQLASVLLHKAEANAMLGETEAYNKARLDSLGWARYGFGPDWAVRARMREIASLNPNYQG